MRSSFWIVLTIPCYRLIPLALSLILTSTQHLVKARLPRLERFYLPVFIMVIPIVFYSVVAAKQALNPPDLRKSGWIFEGPEAGEPWWYFYTLFGRFWSVLCITRLMQ